jgi:hypothetical protein
VPRVWCAYVVGSDEEIAHRGAEPTPPPQKFPKFPKFAAPQGGEGWKRVLELNVLPGVENVAPAPSQGHEWPRRAA